MRVLILNPGSSSLKSSGVEEAGLRPGVPVAPLARINVDWGVDATAATAPSDDIRRLLGRYEEAGIETASLGAVGYRVVHGGTRYREPTRITPDVVGQLDALRELAPLHNGVAVETIRAGLAAAPQLPHVAVFDTAFHATLPEEGFRYPVPERWYRDWGVRRFGFHGMSVAWSSERALTLLESASEPSAASEQPAATEPSPARLSAPSARLSPPSAQPSPPPRELNLVVAHLGSGCSVTAVSAGRSVATSMGLTPLEGLMMGTRSGSIDPGIIFALLRDGRLSVDELSDELDHASGLVGVSGRTSDVRELLALEARGDEAARLALAMFVRRAAECIASAVTSLRTLDAIAFTGGIGENAASVRSRIVARLASIGVAPLAERSVDEDAIVSVAGSKPAILRIEAREDLIVARETARAIVGGGAQRA
jgi:acetate kinase